ncbi:Arylsulfatase [Planctomycetes bacterium MalM25]|nr:Arylsulfatase [Planctomycetes bacterium MalM25]
MKTALLLLGSLLLLTVTGVAGDRPNVLFIAVDDLRPELGCYGSEIAITPHLDELASEGLLFERAYCQEAICSPSRASLMTGARPDTIGVVENSAYFRDTNPDLVTLPQHFIANGYEAVHCGKIYHKTAFADPEHSWSRQPARKRLSLPRPTMSFALEANRAVLAKNKARLEAKYGVGIAGTGLVQGPAFECADVPDQAYRDGYNTDLAIATMREMNAEGDKPFFLGLGFFKPHLNFIAPKRYWDLYERNAIPLSDQTVAPVGGAATGLHPSFELRVRDGIPKSGEVDEELSRTLKHAYLACVSYVDAQIGRMLAALEREGLRDNTIVIVWGDHGWHLGEMGVWGKATNYEIATRVPLIIHAPGMKAVGAKSDALVELVDMYPTLCELAGLSTPEHIEGHSFASLLDEPARPWKQAAFSQFPNPALREWAANPLSQGMRETFFGPLIEEVEGRLAEQHGEDWDRELFEQHLMGYAMRTDRYRLVLWIDTRSPDSPPVAVELYDHEADPAETKNVASEFPELVRQLTEQFHAGWRGAL